MPPVPVSYRFGDRAAARRALELVAQRFRHRRDPATSRDTTYYDTFDWRVFLEGGILFAQSDGRMKILHWADLDGNVRQRLPITARPGFVWDLPAGPLRDALEPILEMRRLLPVVTVETQQETLRILDQRDKTVARIRIEESRAHPARGQRPSSDLPVVVRALPVRGYDRDFSALEEVLQETQSERVTDSEHWTAATAVGLRPGDYSRKPDLQLDPKLRSDEAVKIILRSLLQLIRRNDEGLRGNIDSEFLHDFRVSVRRTRSALTQLKGVFQPAVVDHFKSEFSWLGQITGPTRDLDVYQLKMPGYRASLPEHLQPDLDPLSDFLSRHKMIEHRDLVQLLDSQRYHMLLLQWQDFVDQPVPEETSLPEATTPIFELASRRIWRSYRRVLKKGRFIEPTTPAEALHRLRIECKKLRYLLEFFRSLYQPEQIESLIRSLKRLQDNLGEFNDLEIQQATLRQYAQTMLAEKLATASSLMAMGRLVDRLERRQIEERQDFHQHFKKFSSRANRRRFKQLFKPRETAEA